MSKLLIKLKHYIRRKIFKNLKYEFEEFIPNSMSTSKDTHNLIKININQFSSNLLNVYNYFGKTKIVNINTLKVNLTLQERIKQLLKIMVQIKQSMDITYCIQKFLTIFHPIQQF